jgi:1,4-alpha-glucan branching enzyme
VSALGAFTFVLHSHLPYARLAGRWPHGEEWIHEAACETYIPLLQALYDLKERGVKFHITIGMTPVLAEQLADPLVLNNFEEYLNSKIVAARRDMDYFEGKPVDLSGTLGAMSLPSTPAVTAVEAQAADVDDTPEAAAKADTAVGDAPKAAQDVIADTKAVKVEVVESTTTADTQLRYLAEWYKNEFEKIKGAFVSRFNRDIVGAFRKLQDEGYVEITTSAATHGYLPLLGRDSSIYAQLKTGVASYERLFGRKPSGIWLPECAYRPAYVTEGGLKRPGIETWVAQQGLKVFFSETHTITGGHPVGIAAGDVFGPYGDVKRRYVIPAASSMPERAATTFHPYYVSDTVSGAQAAQHSGVAVIGRNNRTGQQVWSADWGYPGDFDYREFHKKASTSGLQYWRVTGSKVELGHKDYYHPEWAAYKIDQHAEHYAHLVGDILRDYNKQTGSFGLIASNYDTELFGHWWFEGVEWLAKVLEHLAANPEVQLTTASKFVTEHPPQEVLSIPESSWGAGGTHFVWDNADTHWMWEPIHECEERMEKLVAAFPSPTEAELRVLNQAARELLLLQSSDWPFLVTTGQAREYAVERFSSHIDRFNDLATSLQRKKPDVARAEELFHLDNLFPDIDYRWFAAQASN